MNSREFLLKRICIFAGEEFDPKSDDQVIEILLRKFNIKLPQRRSLDESLSATICDHEIITLLIKYRNGV